jgi:hypothetical protein
MAGIGDYEGEGTFSMRNKNLASSAKYGTPMQKNYDSPNKDRRTKIVNDPNTGTSREQSVEHTHDEKTPAKHIRSYGAYTSEDEVAAAKEHNRVHRGKVPGTETKTIYTKKKKEK